jgi:hypothetical protein
MKEPAGNGRRWRREPGNRHSANSICSEPTRSNRTQYHANKRRSYRFPNLGGFTHRELSGKAAVSNKHSDMIHAQAGNGISFA